MFSKVNLLEFGGKYKKQESAIVYLQFQLHCYQYIIIQTYMKGKKNRKQLKEFENRSASRKKQVNELFKVQFDVLKNDISCFINKSKGSKHISRKPSSSMSVPKKQALINKNQQNKILLEKKTTKESSERGSSPDLIRQSSNKILTKIQQEGIRFDWKDQQQLAETHQGNQQNEEAENLWNAFDSSFQKSFASTNDYPSYQSNNYYWQVSNTFQPVMCQNSFNIELQQICNDWRTTIMIRNIPNKYTVGELASEIDSQHENTYDFLYLPCDLKNQCNVGYGFINFVNTQSLHSFYIKFNQYVWKRYRSQKICSLTYARLQGLNQLIQHFQNSKVLNQKDKKYRPIIKYDEIHKMVLEQQKK